MSRPSLGPDCALFVRLWQLSIKEVPERESERERVFSAGVPCQREEEDEVIPRKCSFSYSATCDIQRRRVDGGTL